MLIFEWLLSAWSLLVHACIFMHACMHAPSSCMKFHALHACMYPLHACMHPLHACMKHACKSANLHACIMHAVHACLMHAVHACLMHDSCMHCMHDACMLSLEGFLFVSITFFWHLVFGEVSWWYFVNFNLIVTKVNQGHTQLLCTSIFFFWGGGGELGWAVIWGWGLINFFYLQGGRLFELGFTQSWVLNRINTVFERSVKLQQSSPSFNIIPYYSNMICSPATEECLNNFRMGNNRWKLNNFLEMDQNKTIHIS